MQEIPSWIQAIFAREFNPSTEKELENEIKVWLEKTGDYNSLDDFYMNLMNKTIQKEAIKKDSAAYSIRNFGKGNYLNCNGVASIIAVKGKLEFKKTFKVIIDYTGGKQPNGQMLPFKSHVSLHDGRRSYGGRPDYNNMKTHKLPERALALIYMLSQAYVAHNTGNYQNSRSIASQVKKEIEKDSALDCKYFERRIKEANSNF